MSKSQDVIYEPHPVSPERKAELRAQGLRIIDIQFKPADEQEQAVAEPQEEAPAKRGRKPKAE